MPRSRGYGDRDMDGLDNLKSDWLGRIGGASDEASLEELRVAALGKKGEISLKMRELGQMSPEERQVAGPALNALKDEVNAALAAKKAALADAALDERLRAEWLDVTLPARHRRHGNDPPRVPGDGGGYRDLRRHGIRRGRGAADRDRFLQLRRAQHPRPPPRTGRDGHVLHGAGRGRQSSRPTCCAPTRRRCRSDTWRPTAPPAA
jgi:hypothetical protein